MSKKTFSLLFALAAALRALLIWNAPLWYDENFTYLLSTLPFDKMLAATAGDVHPPLSYIILWLMAQLGGPAWTLRIPSMLFSVGSVVLFAKLLSYLSAGRRVKIAALFIMAVAPFQLWYAQEARMYAMLEFFFLLGVLAVYRRHWMLMLLAGVLLVYTQNYGVLYVVVLWLLAALRADRRWLFVSEMLGPSIAAISTMLMWIPWAQIVLAQASTIAGSYWIMPVSLGAVLDTLVKLFWGSAIPTAATPLAYIVTLVALSIGLCVTICSHRWDWLLLAFGPLLLAVFVSLVWYPILIVRPLIGSAPFVYLIAASALEFLPTQEQAYRRRVPLYLSALIAPVFILGIGGYYIQTPGIKEKPTAPNMSSTLAYIKANWQDGDILYHTDDGSLVNWMAYSPELVHIKMPDCAPVRGALSTETRAALGMPILSLDVVPHTRAWIAAPLSPLHPDCYAAALDDLLADAELVFQLDDNDLITSGVWLK